jgi:hypothetical protein
MKSENDEISSQVREFFESPSEDMDDPLDVFKCAGCHYVTSTEATLNNHTRTCHDDKDLRCHDCSFVTARSQSLAEHINSVHLSVKNCACDQCDSAADCKMCPKKIICDIDMLSDADEEAMRRKRRLAEVHDDDENENKTWDGIHQI